MSLENRPVFAVFFSPGYVLLLAGRSALARAFARLRRRPCPAKKILANPSDAFQTIRYDDIILILQKIPKLQIGFFNLDYLYKECIFINAEDRKTRFVNTVRARSDENERSLNLLIGAECYALTGAILRMELDSLIRVHNYNCSNADTKDCILHGFFEGKKWPSTDRAMVENMPHIMGWAKHIYDFCCAFIHLSPYHDWAESDDIPNLSLDKRRQITQGLREQQNDDWGYDTSLVINENFGFNDLVPFVPHIFKKLRGNLLLELGQS